VHQQDARTDRTRRVDTAQLRTGKGIPARKGVVQPANFTESSSNRYTGRRTAYHTECKHDVFMASQLILHTVTGLSHSVDTTLEAHNARGSLIVGPNVSSNISAHASQASCQDPAQQAYGLRPANDEPDGSDIIPAPDCFGFEIAGVMQSTVGPINRTGRPSSVRQAFHPSSINNHAEAATARSVRGLLNYGS